MVFGDGAFPAELDPASLDGTNGFALVGIRVPYDQSGYSVSAAGDVNGDGIDDDCGHSVGGAGDLNGDGLDDVIIGAAGYDEGGAYVLYGRDDAMDTDGDGVPDGSDNCLEDPNPGQRDTNGDGFGDVCDGDPNGDCMVNFEDLGLMKAASFDTDPDADLNGDGCVSFVGLGLLKTGFLAAPGPSGVANECDDLRWC